MLIAARLTTEAGCHVAICEARQHDKFTHPDTQLRSIMSNHFLSAGGHELTRKSVGNRRHGD